MARDSADTRDQGIYVGDFRNSTGFERRHLTSGSIETFTEPLTEDRPFYIVSIGADSFFTLDGSDPVLTEGTTDVGIPLLDSQPYPVMAPKGGSGSLRVLSAGTPKVIVWRIGEQ